ncbi:MAG: sulfotransferase [Burkholderiales bacterium]|nr:sulfotransferase [Burkholderiales bacterium]
MEADVIRLREWQQQGRHEQVLAEATGHLETFPENRDLLLLAAISARHLKRLDDAFALLDRLEALYPRLSLLHQERGMCQVQLRNAPAAIGSLLLAVNINSALPASWSMLEGLYRLTGDNKNAATAAAHVATLKALPPVVVQAYALFHDGDLALAEPMIRDFLLKHGNHPEAMRLLAKIGLAHDVLDDAELLLAAVLELAPDFRAARHDYAETLVRRHKYREAAIEIGRLLDQDPGNPDFLMLAATTAINSGDNDRALSIYRAMIVAAPDSPDTYLWFGHALKTTGDTEQGVTAYRRAAVIRPDFGDAYWSLANLKRYRFTDDEIARMGAAETLPKIATPDRYHLNFALGKAHEDRGDFAKSWRYYAQGNALKREESRYRPEIIETNTRLQKTTITPDFLAARQGWGHDAPDPIFIVGLPRAGSTLLEQILASHSQVEGTQELAEIQRTVIEFNGRNADLDNPAYPGVLADLKPEDFVRLGERYLRDTRIHRGDKPFFIDKMPNNFRHIGLIHLILPNAKIIDARREPMSCCFSNLKQLFAQGQEFTYSAEDIARYYRTYLDIMAHWDEVLPGRVLRVHHEDVVDDLEGSVRRILDYCGLPFEQACVEFHKTERSVRTPSSEQVRQPIFRDGLDQWKKFEPWLEPLRTTLGDALTRYRAQP